MIADVPVSSTQVARKPSIVTGIVVRVAFVPLASTTADEAAAWCVAAATAATPAATDSSRANVRNGTDFISARR
jgi:hypothetical protein